jgi:hypothetical protein
MAEMSALDIAMIDWLKNRIDTQWTSLDVDALTDLDRVVLRRLTAAGVLIQRYAISLSAKTTPHIMHATILLTGTAGLQIVRRKLRQAFRERTDIDHYVPPGFSLKMTETSFDICMTQLGTRVLQLILDGEAAEVLRYVQRTGEYQHEPPISGSGLVDRIHFMHANGQPMITRHDIAALAMLQEMPADGCMVNYSEASITDRKTLSLLIRAGWIEEQTIIRFILPKKHLAIEGVISMTGDVRSQDIQTCCVKMAMKLMDFAYADTPCDELERPVRETIAMRICLTADGEAARRQISAGELSIVRTPVTGVIELRNVSSIFEYHPTPAETADAQPAVSEQLENVTGKLDEMLTATRQMHSESRHASDRLSTTLEAVAQTQQHTSERITDAIGKSADATQKGTDAIVAAIHNLTSAPKVDKTPTTSSAEPRSVEEVTGILLRIRDRGEPYTQERELAERIGCSKSTINKAIQANEILKGWRTRYAKKKSLRACSLDSIILDEVPSTREPQPHVDVDHEDMLLSGDEHLFREILEMASPQERNKLNQMDHESKKELINLVRKQRYERKSHRLLNREP